MRYRMLSDLGDYVFGSGPSEFLINSPAAVAQAVRTRLLLGEGEWFLDLDEGTPYLTRILGERKQVLYDSAIQERILDTPGVTSIDEYQSQLDDTTRTLTVTATITTIYGQITIQQVF